MTAFRAIPRRFRIEAFVVGVHGFLVAPNRAAAFPPLAGLEDAGHHDEGPATRLGDPNTEPRGDGVPEVLLCFAGLQVPMVGEVTLFRGIAVVAGVDFCKNRYHLSRFYSIAND